MKILIVKYLPASKDSNTGKLLDYFKRGINKFHKVEELDLLKNPPPYFNEESLYAYKQRNFGGKVLTEDQQKAIEPMDLLTQQFKNSDLIVFAFPMHNYSIPGIIKLYFDAILQKDQVFTYNGEQSIGLMSTTKFITIYTSMGNYRGEYGFMDNVKTIMRIELDFMGFKEYEFIHAMTGSHITRDINIENAKKEVKDIILKWKL